MCDYTVEELDWLSLNGHSSTGAPLSSPDDMDDVVDTSPAAPVHSMVGEEPTGPIKSGLRGSMAEDPPHYYADRMNKKSSDHTPPDGGDPPE